MKRDRSRSGASASSRNSSSGSQDEGIRNYICEFRKEVETKFRLSKANTTFVFPRKCPPRPRKAELTSSFDSLENVAFYDLESQNAKRCLLTGKTTPVATDTDQLVDVVKALGKLDPRYLRSQLADTRSTLFRILRWSVERKIAAKKASVDTKNSGSREVCSQADISKLAKRSKLIPSLNCNQPPRQPPTPQATRTRRCSASPLSQDSSSVSVDSQVSRPKPADSVEKSHRDRSRFVIKNALRLPALGSLGKTFLSNPTHVGSPAPHSPYGPPKPVSLKTQISAATKHRGEMKKSAGQLLAHLHPPKNNKTARPLLGVSTAAQPPDSTRRKETFKKFVVSHKKNYCV